MATSDVLLVQGVPLLIWLFLGAELEVEESQEGYLLKYSVQVPVERLLCYVRSQGMYSEKEER